MPQVSIILKKTLVIQVVIAKTNIKIKYKLYNYSLYKFQRGASYITIWVHR